MNFNKNLYAYPVIDFDGKHFLKKLCIIARIIKYNPSTF